MSPEEHRAELERPQEAVGELRRRLRDGDGDIGAPITKVDDANTAWLKALVVRDGWPAKSVVGEDGAHAAWLLAQHADRDPEFQRRCLQLMEQAVRAGEASTIDLAYLTDRVLLAQGQAQLHGTS